MNPGSTRTLRLATVAAVLGAAVAVPAASATDAPTSAGCSGTFSLTSVTEQAAVFVPGCLRGGEVPPPRLCQDHSRHRRECPARSGRTGRYPPGSGDLHDHHRTRLLRHQADVEHPAGTCRDPALLRGAGQRKRSAVPPADCGDPVATASSAAVRLLRCSAARAVAAVGAWRPTAAPGRPGAGSGRGKLRPHSADTGLVVIQLGVGFDLVEARAFEGPL